MSELPKLQREELAEELAFKYPTWFFELFTEIEGAEGRGPTILEDYQIDYLNDESTYKIGNKCRQVGGSLMVSMQKMYRAMRRTSYRCDIVSINLKESIDKIRYIRKLHDTLPIRWKVPLTVDNATSIGFHTGSRQSIVHSLAASAGIRGGRKEVVFDEFGWIKLADELYIAATPAIMNGQLALDIISTPNGNLNKFAEIWNNEKNFEGIRPYSMYNRYHFIWADCRRFVRDFEGVQHTWYNVYHENMDYMPDLVKEYGTDKLLSIYAQFPRSQFYQEFCGVFLDELTAFFPSSLIQRCLRPPYAKTEYDEEREYLDPWSRRPKGNTNQIFMGVDYGESEEETDKTSIQILERLPDGRLMHRYSEVLNKDDYPDFPSQAAHIVDVYKAFRPQRVSADDTGLGRGINPFIRKYAPDIPLEEVNFNFATKEEMVMNLKGLMENGNIWLQQGDTQLQGQIRNIERKIGENGRATYHGKPHDDMFWALALAARAGAYKPFAIYSLGSRRASVL